MLLWIGRNFTIPPSSNNPPPVNTPWLAGPNDHCKYCDTRADLAHCNVCGIPVCGRHRAGSGDRSDGYSCDDHVIHTLTPPKPTIKVVIEKRRHKLIEMVKADPFAATMFLIALFCMTALMLHWATGWPTPVPNVR